MIGRTALLLSAVAFLSAACGGESAAVDDDALTVDDSATGQNGQALAVDGAEADDPTSDCNDHDHDKHHHHRHHLFKVLDRIDGTKDHAITIASLPAALPPRLLARLHEMDADGDGVVTKDEVKAFRHEEKAERKAEKKAEKAANAGH